MTIRIAICGITGRMGGRLVELLGTAEDLELAGGIAASAHAGEAPYPIHTPSSCAPLLAAADVLVDFSSPTALSQVLQHAGAALHGKAIVSGTTGLTIEQDAAIDAISQQCAVVTAANFSAGVNLLLNLVARAAGALGEDYDIEIVEAHHGRKIDAPSGTALALGEAAARGRDVALEKVRRDGRSGETGRRPAGEIGFHSLRGGGVIGEHSVYFLGEDERIEFAHSATDRLLFARGALNAARWVQDRAPGRYSMNDVLGL